MSSEYSSCSPARVETSSACKAANSHSSSNWPSTPTSTPTACCFCSASSASAPRSRRTSPAPAQHRRRPSASSSSSASSARSLQATDGKVCTRAAAEVLPSRQVLGTKTLDKEAPAAVASRASLRATACSQASCATAMGTLMEASGNPTAACAAHCARSRHKSNSFVQRANSARQSATVPALHACCARQPANRNGPTSASFASTIKRISASLLLSTSARSFSTFNASALLSDVRACSLPSFLCPTLEATILSSVVPTPSSTTFDSSRSNADNMWCSWSSANTARVVTRMLPLPCTSSLLSSQLPMRSRRVLASWRRASSSALRRPPVARAESCRASRKPRSSASARSQSAEAR
mmetsp:Transcript_126122/g.403604  ORF Transcript_126122/g.403604 Transcript_126122/m.403604 type:complete len:353 (+) Transcript_126122:1703-2761(+)